MKALAPTEITLSTLGRLSEAEARRMLERLRWPDGRPICPHCGVIGDAKRMESGEETEHRLRDGVLNCRSCRKPFTVTVGTIFEGSHIPIAKWLLGFYLFASSKKSMSALQLQRQLALGSYRTAWHMAHRIRHAMQNDPNPGKLDGEVEADEVYIGGKPRNKAAACKGYGRGTKKQAVAVLVQRGGGARARPVHRVDAETLKGFIREHVARSANLFTDEWSSYKGLAKEYAGHEVVQHGRGEYARGNVHSNTAESFNGLFKRSIQGAWHHISREHIGRYLDEQVFRWTLRKVTDGERTVAALDRVGGVRLYYKRPTQPDGERGQSLVACG